MNYTYDLDSHLTQVTDPTGIYAFIFDNLERLTGTATSYAILTARKFTTAYDTLNRLQTLTPPSAFGAISKSSGADSRAISSPYLES